MVQHGGLGGAGGLPVVMDGNGVQQLGPDPRVQARGPLLDQAHAEVDVAEQAALLGLAEGRTTPELERASDVVQERRGEQKVVTQSRMELRGLAAQRGHADRMLEESARVAVVGARACGGKRAQRGPDGILGEDGDDDDGEPAMRDLACEEVEKAVELVGVAPHRRRQLRWIGVRRSFDGAHLHLQPAAEPLDTTEHANGIAFDETAVEQLDVVPDPRLDASARIDELQREVGSAALRPAAFLASDGVDALDCSILRELGDAGHEGSLGGLPESRAARPRASPGQAARAGRYARAVADVAPFRAIRYARSSPALTAPPYDVLTPEMRDMYRARDPHNVVHLTLNDSEDEAGRLFRTWLEEGVLVRDEEPSVWAVAQDYLGPDGVQRHRDGLVASLRVEPYETHAVLPHERTHAGPKASRLRLLRAARAQLEPIFLLYDGEPPFTVPEREPEIVAGDTRLWRVPGEGVADAFAGRQLLIADGHHRYETAVAFAAEEKGGAGTRMMVVLVSTSDPGLEIFPTHRLFRGHDDALPSTGDETTSPATAVTRLAGLPYDRARAVGYRRGVTFPVTGEPGELDVELVDRLVGHDGLGYSPDLDEAVARVDSGEFGGAFLLRPTRIEDVFERARRGEVMPQKTTYFFPKLTSGLLFHPV